jgi:hypothetical protein
MVRPEGRKTLRGTSVVSVKLGLDFFPSLPATPGDRAIANVSTLTFLPSFATWATWATSQLVLLPTLAQR